MSVSLGFRRAAGPADDYRDPPVILIFHHPTLQKRRRRVSRFQAATQAAERADLSAAGLIRRSRRRGTRAAVSGASDAGLLVMEVRLADSDDMRQLPGLLGRFDEIDQLDGPKPAFATDLLRWWETHQESHVPFLAVLPTGTAVGMAWLAIAARVPRPGGRGRLCGDIQSVYVVPEHRSAGIGTALIEAVARHADALGLEHVTVHANQQARSLYERGGFAASRDLLMRTHGKK